MIELYFRLPQNRNFLRGNISSGGNSFGNRIQVNENEEQVGNATLVNFLHADGLLDVIDLEEWRFEIEFGGCGCLYERGRMTRRVGKFLGKWPD